jgi:hypothetical protein
MPRRIASSRKIYTHTLPGFIPGFKPLNPHSSGANTGPGEVNLGSALWASVGMASGALGESMRRCDIRIPQPQFKQTFSSPFRSHATGTFTPWAYQAPPWGLLFLSKTNDSLFVYRRIRQLDGSYRGAPGGWSLQPASHCGHFLPSVFCEPGL